MYCPYLKAISHLSTKLYSDNAEIELFLVASREEMLSYSRVKYYPEIFDTIETLMKKLFKKELKIGDEWKNQKQTSYIVALNVKYASDAIDDTTGSVKKLKKSLLGIDELNLLTDNSDSGGGGADFGGGGGGFDFELPEYDFLGELANSRVAQIVEEMKEWLGLTEDINSWSELMDTRFGHILKLVGSISAGIALWKLSKAFLAGIAALKALLESPTQTITLGLSLTLTGFAIEFSGVADAIQNGLEGFNFSEILMGGLLYLFRLLMLCCVGFIILFVSSSPL